MSTGRRWAEDTRPLREGQSTDSGSGVRGAPQILTGDVSPKNFALAANDTGVVTSTRSVPGRETKGPLLPVAPLVSAIRHDLAGRALRGLGDAAARAVQRAIKRDGFTVAGADELCVLHLGRHPIEVYGDEWLVGT